jgi:hypothetical protein
MNAKLRKPRRAERLGTSDSSIKLAGSASEDFGIPATGVIEAEFTSAAAEAAERRQLAEREFGAMATALGDAFPPGVLKAVSGESFQRAIHAGGFKVFFDRFLAAAGNPTDPFEIMLIEQLVWAHFQIGTFMAKAANAQSLQEADIFTKAFVNAMAEFRRGLLALDELRSRRHARPSPNKTAFPNSAQNSAVGDVDSSLSIRREKRPRTAK